MEFEENEALSREGDEDLKLFKEICEKFRKTITEVADLKVKNGAKVKKLGFSFVRRRSLSTIFKLYSFAEYGLTF